MFIKFFKRSFSNIFKSKHIKNQKNLIIKQKEKIINKLLIGATESHVNPTRSINEKLPMSNKLTINYKTSYSTIS
tara:strand:- start:4903 stop:5127 length:225 start_codon:yes stop_codon:yes gene_type:complete